MTLSWYNRLVRFWETEPPVDILVAQFLGFEPPQRSDSRPTWENESIEELLGRWQANAGARIGRAGG